MKLNLVPTHVSKEKASGGSIFAFEILKIAVIILCVIMVSVSGKHLQDAKDAETESLQKAADTKAISDQADTLMASAPVNMLVRDVSLANAMEDHSAVYPNLYGKVRNYVPSYYRVTSMAAAPGDAETCTVTMSGVLTTYQQYVDLGLALMRIPGAVSYSPSGYQVTDKFTPPLTPEDMTGRPIRPGESNIPDDAWQRLQNNINDGHLTGYNGANGFGNSDITLKGPMPNSSQVTITIVLKGDLKNSYNLLTPDPRATLSAGASGGTTSAANGAAGGFGSPGGGSPAAPAGAGAAPASPPPAAPPAKGGKKGKGTGDDE